MHIVKEINHWCNCENFDCAEVNKVYKHYKGNLYKIISFAKHSETLEDLVVYQELGTSNIWARPSSMWNEYITTGGEKVQRFTPVEDPCHLLGASLNQILAIVDPTLRVDIYAYRPEREEIVSSGYRCGQIPRLCIQDYLEWRARSISTGVGGLEITLEEPNGN